MAREARDDGDRVTVLRVDPQHRHAVVHRPLAADPVDADPGRAAGSRADARRPPPAPGRVDGPGEQVGQRRPPTGRTTPVSASPATVEPRETLGALWLCAAFTSTASGGIPVSFCTRSRTAAVMSAPAKTRSTATIAIGLAAVVEDERLRDHRLVDSLGEAVAGRPAAVRQAAGRGDVDTGDAGGQIAHGRVLSHCWATSSPYASGRRFLRANHGFSRARSTSAGSSSTPIHWSPVPGSDLREHRPVGREDVGAADVGAVPVEPDHVREDGVDAVVPGEEVVQPRRARPRLEQLLLGAQHVLLASARARARRR